MSLRSLSLLPPSSLEAMRVPAFSAPLTVEFITTPKLWKLAGRQLKQVRVELGDESVPVETRLNPWDVRNNFLRADSSDGMLSMLNDTGVFSRSGTNWNLSDLNILQRIIRHLMKVSPSRWRMTPKLFEHLFEENQKIVSELVRHSDQRVRFSWAEGSHAAVIVTSTTLEALLASVHVDHLRGARYAFCAREDCGSQYELVSKHPRKYCSYECAHLLAVRRSRAKRVG